MLRTALPLAPTFAKLALGSLQISGGDGGSGGSTGSGGDGGISGDDGALSVEEAKVALLRRGVPHPAGRPSRGMHKFNQIGA
jgi:hypothetical protein